VTNDNSTYPAQMRHSGGVLDRSGEAGPLPGPPSAGTTCQCTAVDWPFGRMLICSASRDFHPFFLINLWMPCCTPWAEYC